MKYPTCDATRLKRNNNADLIFSVRKAGEEKKSSTIDLGKQIRYSS